MSGGGKGSATQPLPRNHFKAILYGKRVKTGWEIQSKPTLDGQELERIDGTRRQFRFAL